jgi:hypothetical protein
MMKTVDQLSPGVDLLHLFAERAELFSQRLRFTTCEVQGIQEATTLVLQLQQEVRRLEDAGQGKEPPHDVLVSLNHRFFGLLEMLNDIWATLINAARTNRDVSDIYKTEPVLREASECAHNIRITLEHLWNDADYVAFCDRRSLDRERQECDGGA